MNASSLLNMGTLSTVYALSCIVYALILGMLWRETTSRYHGPGWWMTASILQAAGLVLLLLRGIVPSVIPIVLGNTCLVIGLLTLRLGLARFVGIRTSLVADLIAIPLFVAGMVVFTVAIPSTWARTLLVSAVFLLFAVEGSVVLWARAPRALRTVTSWPALIIGIHALASLVRIVITVLLPQSATENWYASPGSQSIFMLVYQLLNLAVIFSLFLMVTRRMREDEHDIEESRRAVEEALRESEGRQSAIFRASPLGMMLSRYPDGRVRDVNDSFLALIARKREDVVGKLTTELDIWARIVDRERLVAGLADTGVVRDAEIRYLRAGQERDALLTMELVQIEGETYVLNLAADITERKVGEREREHMIGELQAALAEVKTLSGLMPICASCKKVRDDSGYWHQVESYFEAHSDLEFTHGLCPDCLRRLYPELAAEVEDPETRSKGARGA